ncbi:SynChlorMet cassette protein ScmC [Methanocella sp. CWC-04]|uniref:SynChlorMet cassette protein ScmC n=1 Tax=Methanooceanicella nereidis TaxID=2052831 RepID=A0AAP2W650_9EURY|nr:SynChlorMet cassette protein ScmC [Methanocella sp. CWC-04]MCD1294897.1 SynChlorMet cassette protein ScmC [Methanocella sp. CWC-04]
MRSFLLRLSNGRSWRIIPTKTTISWVERFASIMRLKACGPDEDGINIYFITDDLEKFTSDSLDPKKYDELPCYLPGNGWNYSQIGLIKIWQHEDVPDIICAVDYKEEYHEPDIILIANFLSFFYNKNLKAGCLPFHAGLVELNGKGVLLTAPSKTGKSTCCRRIPSPWNTICDEEVLIVRDTGSGRYHAHPFPTWSDFLERNSPGTWDVSRHFPVEAIFLLEQSRKDEVIPVGKGAAASVIYRSAMDACHRYWVNLSKNDARSLNEAIFHNSCEIAKEIPLFKLRVSISGRFWEEIEIAIF